MANWKAVGGSVLVGGVAGVLDQVIEKKDDERAAALTTGTLGAFKRIGTYYNYGIPILAVILAASGVMEGEWSDRLITAGAQLAARKITWQIQKPKPAGYPRWQARGGEMAERAAMEAAERARVARESAVHEDAYVPTHFPQPIELTPSAPIVQPQGAFGGRGTL